MSSDNTKVIKEKIVETYRRGVCDKDGNTLPKHKWGMAGKGSSFMGSAYYNEKFRTNYELIFGKHKYNTWPRDEQGNLIE